MRYRYFILLLSFCYSIVLADTRMATVSGNVYLSDQTSDHSGVKILFQSESSSATTDSVYSNADGSYNAGLTDGVYTVHFSKTGYIPYTWPGSFSWGGDSYTIDDVTLQAGSLIEVAGRTNGIWYSNYQYRVIGDIQIEEGDSLVIEPGTSVLFMGDYKMEVQGSLIAVGTEQDSIYITSGRAVKESNDWDGIIFDYAYDHDLNRRAIFQYCNIGYGGGSNEHRMLSFYNEIEDYENGNVKVLNSYLHHANNGIFYSRYWTVDFSDNHVDEYGDNDAVAVYHAPNAIISNNQIINNRTDYSYEYCIFSVVGVDHYDEAYHFKSRYDIYGNYAKGRMYSLYLSNQQDYEIDTVLVYDNTFEITGWSTAAYLIAFDDNVNIFRNNKVTHGGGYIDGYGIKSYGNNIIRNNLIKGFSEAFLPGQTSSNTVFQQNIVMENRYAINNSESFINMDYSYNILYDNERVYQYPDNADNGPPGLGEILTINANGDSTDTYMNLFQNPLFTPTADSTVQWSYSYSDSILYLSYNKPESWGELSQMSAHLGLIYDDAYYWYQNYYMEPEIIDATGSRFSQSTYVVPGIEVDASESGLDTVEPDHLMGIQDPDNDPKYRIKNGLEKITSGSDIANFTNQQYVKISPANRRAALLNNNIGFSNPLNSRTADVTISVTVDSWPGEASWNVYDYQTESYYYEDNQTFSDNYENQQVMLELEVGSYSVDCWDTYGDGGISGVVTGSDGNTLVSWSVSDYSSFGEFQFVQEFGEDVVWGCTDPDAINYDPDATGYDGSCYYYGDSCTIALEPVIGINEGSGYAQWFEYTAVSNESIFISSDLQGNDQDTYLLVYEECDSDDPIIQNDDGVGNLHYWGGSEVSFSCTAGQTYYILWEDYYTDGPFSWQLREGTVSTTSWSVSLNIYDLYDSYGYVFNQLRFEGYSAQGWHYSEVYANQDFIGLPEFLQYESYTEEIGSDSPCLDAGNPDPLLYDPDGTIADIGLSYYHQGDLGDIPAPSAGFTVSSTSGAYPLFVEFTSTSTGAITGYSWNFGDGNTSTSTRPVHLYNAEGVYSVSLTVTGPGGEDTQIESDYITVTSPSLPPIASFVGEPTSGLTPLTVSFSSTVLNGANSVAWDFGDGNTSTELDPVHTYTEAGSYTVTFSASNTYGTDIAVQNSYITVLPPEAVVADFSGVPLVGVAPHEVAFVNETIGSLDSVRWNFTDGGSSDQLSPLHTFETPGLYGVTLMAYGPVNSDTTTRLDYIDVYDERPIITSIEDIPDDQGGQVLLRWAPSGWDGPVGTTITQYSLWEEYNDEWININTSMASQSDSYVFLASTFGDSTSDGINWSRFKIYAHTVDPSVYYVSPVDSGYSVDNVPPQAPSDLLASIVNDGVELEWSEVTESNFMYYNVYRNGEIIAQVSEDNFTDTSAGQVPAYYRITAVDEAGNESNPTPESMVNATDLNWFINFRGTLMGSQNDLYNFLGTADSASSDFDESFDIFEPPTPPGSYLTMYFPHPDWELELGSDLTQDIRGNIDLSDTMHVWNIDITSNVSDSAVFVFDMVDVPEVPIMIEHLQSGDRAYLADSSWFGFNIIADSIYSFRISIGDTTSPTLALDPNTSGPQILLSDSTHLFSWALGDGNGIDSVHTYFSLDNGETYHLVSDWSGYNESLSWVVPDTTVIYNAMFGVEVRDYAGNSVFEASDHAFAFAGDSLSIFLNSGWNLWGAPLVPYEGHMDDNVDDDVEGYWFTYGFEDNGYTLDSSLVLGNGYWLGIMEDIHLDVLGTPMTSSQSRSLSSGWNLVSNPLILDIDVDSLLFEQDDSELSYSDAVAAGWVNALYTYDSLGYTLAEELVPWHGYWLSAVDSGVSIHYPIHVPSDSNGSSRQDRDELSWYIPFISTVDGAIDRTTRLGVMEDATLGFDASYDIAKAPNPPGNDYVTLSSMRPDWGHELGDRFAYDFQGPIDQDSWIQWDLLIDSNQDSVHIEWELIDIPDEYEIGYNFGDGLFFQDLREVNQLNVSGSSQIIIRVGAMVLGNDNGITIPSVFALHQNYPNPFNPVTTINYDIPKETDVTIKVHDIVGREISVLVKGKQMPGYHTVNWNGKNANGSPVSAGMYFYTIKTDEFHSMKKMIFLK